VKIFIPIIILLGTKFYGQNGVDTIAKRGIDIYASASKDSLNGKSFIDFETQMLNGQKFKLSEHKGKVILLNFWFISCPPCLGEISDINKVYRQYKDSGVVVVSLALNSVDKLNKFNEARSKRQIEKIEYPIIPNCQGIADKYKISGYPTTVLIDKNGLIRAYTGASLQSLKKYISIYGDKDLSKDWKKIAKEYSNVSAIEVSDILSGLLNDLLKE